MAYDERGFRARNRDRAIEQFPRASTIARRHGLILKRIDSQHYQLTHESDRWLLNLYPGNCRIYMDRNRPRAPWLKFDDPEDWDEPTWTLESVIAAAIEAVGGTPGKEQDNG